MKKVENYIFKKPKKKFFRMIFLISVPKNGAEIIYKNRIGLDNKEFFVPTDSYGENRGKRNDGIIGTTLVNIINHYTEIQKALETTKTEIEKIDIKDIHTLAIEKYHIDKLDKKSLIQHIEKVSETVDTKLFEEDIMLNEFEELSKIKDKNLNILCKFLKELYNNKNLDCINFDYIIKVLSEENNEKAVNTLFLSMIIPKFQELKLNIGCILFKKHNIFNTIIEDFLLELEYVSSILETDSFLYYKYSIIDTYEIKDSTNTFYAQLSDYFNKGMDNTNINFLSDFCSMFLDTLIDNLEYILINISVYDLKKKESIINKIIPITEEDFDMELPRTYILHKEIKHNFYGQEYKKQNIKPNAYSYNITNLLELYNVTRYHLKLDNREIHICKNCKKYFVTNTRNSEIFCRRRISEYKGKGVKYCYQIGQQEKKSQKIDNIKHLHHTLYNRFRNNYKDTEFPKYMREYEKKRAEYKNGNITKKQYENFFIKYDNNFKKKHPSDRYERKSNNKNK